MEESTKKIFLQTAEQIAAKICRDAIWVGNRCNWLGDSREYIAFQPGVVLSALSPEVYGGTSGIALFLAKIYEQTDERIFRLTAEGAINHALSLINDIRPEVSISYYSGQLGVAHTGVQVGISLNNPTLIEEGMAIGIQATKQTVDTQLLDVISGSASGIPTLLFLYEKFGHEEFLQTAIQHGEHLLKHIEEDLNGYSWKTVGTHEASHNLCGLAHGAGGIGLGFIELYAVTKDDRFLKAGREAFRYEESWFNQDEGNYPDFRQPLDVPSQIHRDSSYMMAWCHGAPGIGITRVRAYELLHDKMYQQQAERAVQSTIRYLKEMSGSQQNNYSLCHGMSGNAAFLQYAAYVFRNDTYLEIVNDVSLAGIEQYPKNRLPWGCGVFGGGETPNLMLGTAGIGSFFLSLYNSTQGKLPPLWPGVLNLTH